jgi:CheY-specific phosphatase CheX
VTESIISSKPVLSIDEISKIFLTTAQHTLETSTQLEVTYSSTIQKIPKVSMKPDLTCFVQFSGDYNGLVVVNFSANAALKIYQSYMKVMGMPEDEITDNIASAEVTDTIGEMTNQVMGHLTKNIEEKYDLNADFGQPKALTLSSAITLVIDSDYGENRRLSFKIGNNNFRIEIAMEHAEFIML